MGKRNSNGRHFATKEEIENKIIGIIDKSRRKENLQKEIPLNLIEAEQTDDETIHHEEYLKKS